MPHNDVRVAQAADRQGVLALVPRLREFGSVLLRPVDALDAGEARTLNAYFDLPTEGAKLWVAKANEHIIGAAYATVMIDYFTREQHAHLGIFMVAQASEGSGVAGALLDTVERWAGDCGFRFLTLNVFAANERARRFYERHQFEADIVRYLKPISP
jgi:GNAT superfamily N-acetyltransferase